MFKNAKLRTKLIGMIVCLLLLVTSTMTVLGLNSLKKAIENEKNNQTTQMVNTGLGVLEHFHKMELDNTLTRQQAQDAAKAAIKAMTYGKDRNDYFWTTIFILI